MADTDLADIVRQASALGCQILGICGDYQMPGKRVYDPFHQEDGTQSEAQDIGLFDYQTTISNEKHTVLAAGELFPPFAGVAVRGYEIHMGRTTALKDAQPLARINEPTSGPAQNCVSWEGVVGQNGRVIGPYLHGILHNDGFRTRWLNQIRQDKGLLPKAVAFAVETAQEAAYDRLANVVRRHLDLPQYCIGCWIIRDR